MRRSGNRTIYKRLIFGVSICGIVFLSVVHLESVPPFSWDEGWTLSVARNWVERGFYARLLMGNPAPIGLQASTTVTVPVVLAFQSLGVGIWQGRIVGVLFLIGAVICIYVLAARMYDRTVANIAVAALFLTAAIFPQLHPIVQARQVLGEIPMLFFLLGGYLCFYGALYRSLWFMPLAVLLWALGVVTKAQAPPFFVTSLLAPLVVAIYSRQWKYVAVIVCGLGSTVLATKFLRWLEGWLLAERSLAGSALPEIYGIVAFVPDLQIRSLALQVSLFLLPTVLGVLYEARKSLRADYLGSVKNADDIIRMTLLGFAGSWLAWYVFFSNAYPRYAFPASFAGAIFVAKLLRDLLDRQIKVFARQETVKSSQAEFVYRSVSPDLLLAILLITVWSVSTLKMLHRVYVTERDESVQLVAQFLNSQTSPDAVIETYDSEVHFLLDRRYHYPADKIHLDLIRRALYEGRQRVSIDYNPLAADPDYLVVGEFIKGLRLYDPVLASDAFRLVQSFGRYDLYERVR